MPTSDHSAIAELLGIQAPWVVTGTQLSASLRVFTVVLEQEAPRARLFSRGAVAPIQRRYMWEHIAFGGWRCQIKLVLRQGGQIPTSSWTGHGDEPYTRGLQREILDLLTAGATVEQLSVLLRLPFADLWRYKFRLDQGQGAKAISVAPAPSAGPMVRPGSATAATAATAANIPAESDPTWMAILLGRMKLDVRMLGLRLLLAKLQREAQLHGDGDLHRQAAGDIHRYFVRSQSQLRHELEQVAAYSTQVATLEASQLPAASDPLWLAVLQDDFPLDVRQLGLRLLLSKLRTQLRTTTDDDARMIKLVEIHRYFVRNKNMLAHEIEQISRWAGH
jgi:hypothetical protein